MANVTIGEERFDFGRVVSQTFGLIGRNFVLFFLMALIFVGVPQFALEYGRAYLFQSGDYVTSSYLAFGGWALSLICTFILQGALTRASVDDLSGKGVQFGAALGDGLRFFFPLLIVALLVTIGLVIGFILLIIPGIILAVRWIVATPAAVIEREGPTRAIGRSAELGEGHGWAIFGLILLYAVFAYAMLILFGIVIGATVGGLGQDGMITSLSPTSIVVAAISAAVGGFTSLFSTVGIASLYFELRRVKEGVNVEDLASVFD